MPEAFLHIGQPKTGTTSIQAALVKHADELASQGVYVSRMLWCSKANLGPLNIAFSDADRFTPAKLKFVKKRGVKRIEHLRSRVEKAIDESFHLGFEKYVFSNEGLYFLESRSELDALKSAFSQFDAKVVLFLREPLDFLTSLFPGKTIPDEIGDLPESVEHLVDYERRVTTLQSVFGPDNVHVVSYDKVDMIGRFFDVIGCKADFVSSITTFRENERRSFVDTLDATTLDHLFAGRSFSEVLELSGLS